MQWVEQRGDAAKVRKGEVDRGQGKWERGGSRKLEWWWGGGGERERKVEWRGKLEGREKVGGRRLR